MNCTLLAQEVVGNLATEYAKLGVMGLSIVALGSAVVVLWRENGKLREQLEASLAARVTEAATLQERRTADANAVTDRMLAVNTQCVTTLANVANTMEAQRDAFTEVRSSIKELADNVNRMGRR